MGAFAVWLARIESGRAARRGENAAARDVLGAGRRIQQEVSNVV